MRGLPALYPQGVRRQTLALRAVMALYPQGVRRQTLALRAVMALALLVAAGTALADSLRGVVFVVIDGDTVLFRPEHVAPRSRAFLKIRLADIDAPELGQPHGEAAARALRALVLNKRVEIDTLATDAYGRKIARIRKGALEVNLEMVRRGAAWASTRYRRNVALKDAQREARRANRGLWQADSPTPPWVWRREHAAR